MTTPSFGRRSFLGGLVASGGAAAFPASLARWFAPQDPVPDDKVVELRRKELRTAVQQAKDHGKPLLVFLLPADQGDARRFERGRWFGVLLNHGGADVLFDVAVCVPACATVADLQAVAGTKPIEGDPLLLVVDVARVGSPDAPPPRVTPLVLELGDPQRAAKEDGIDDVSLAKFGAELHRTIAHHAGGAGELAAAARAAMDDEQRAAVAAFLAGAKAPADDVLVRAAAMVLGAAAERGAEASKHLLDTLREAVVRTSVKRRPLGGAWYREEGCGIAVENDAGEAVPLRPIECGLGRVPPKCRRFLDLYSRH